MRLFRVRLLAVTLGFAFGCSGSEDGSSHPGPADGSGGRGGSSASGAGAAGQSGASPASAGSATTTGAAGKAGQESGGNTAAGASGSSGGRAGSASGGVGAGAGGRVNGAGGSSNGGATGSNGGSAGAGACVPNLACKPTPPPSTGDLHQDCVDRINQFLTECACLPALTRRKDGEACADQMAEYDAGKNTAHAGFTDKICTPSGSQNECPGYSSNNQVIGLCMQQMWDEGPPPTNPCNGTCYEEHGHFINMTDKTVTKVACGFYTTASGKVWAAQNFSR